MAKNYKMVMLKLILSRGVDHWLEPVTPKEVAPFFHRYFTEKEYRKRIDFSDKAAKQMWEYDEKKVGKLITTMPMSKWGGSSKGMVTFELIRNSLNQLMSIFINGPLKLLTTGYMYILNGKQNK
jgi:hypothetical protein